MTIKHDDQLIMDHITQLTRHEENIKALWHEHKELQASHKDLERVVRKMQIKIATWSSVGAFIGSVASIIINHLI